MASDFNFNARHPFNLGEYQKAGCWIEAYRIREGGWPVSSDYPETPLFSQSTFDRALHDMKLHADDPPPCPFVNLDNWQ